jgi:Fe-S-cluster-containing hydrogenase component 2
MTIATTRTQAPVVVDQSKCIAEKGCTVCVDVCPLDVLAIDIVSNKAFM